MAERRRAWIVKPPNWYCGIGISLIDSISKVYNTEDILKGLFRDLTDFSTWMFRKLHCKEPIPNIRNKCSKKRDCAATVPISTFICLWAIYIFSWSICLFCWRKYVDRSWEYIFVQRQMNVELGNWAITRKGIHKWDFRFSVYALIIKTCV